MSDANFSAAANAIDERLRTRVFVPAGPHEVAIAFVAAQQRRNAGAARAAHARPRPAEHERPAGRRLRERGWPLRCDRASAIRRAGARSSSASRAHRAKSAVRQEDPHAACTSSPTGDPCHRARPRAVARVLRRRARGRRHFRDRHPHALRVCSRARTSCSAASPIPTTSAPGALYAVDDIALASRLSFFLWSSLPDEELLELAERGQACRSRRSTSNRCGACSPIRARARSWRTSPANGCICAICRARGPDVRSSRTSTRTCGKRCARETELFFESIMREDRSVLELSDRRLHVRESAARRALRHPERLRQPLPPRPGGETRLASGCSGQAASRPSLRTRTARRRYCAASRF